ncbi:MAG: EAL domain-containing protein [Candidatus Hydrogenedentota bacterium]
MSAKDRLEELEATKPDFRKAQDGLVRILSDTYHLSRVNILLYNRKQSMLEAVSSVGHPQYDYKDIRIPIIRMDGMSSRAVQCRAFLENREIVVTDRSEDPEYSSRHKFPHKTYSREFAVFPLLHGKRKLGILAVAVDHNNPTSLSDIAPHLQPLLRQIARLIASTLPKAPTDRKMMSILKETLQKGLLYPVFQPIIDVRRGTVHAVESLLRIRHPEITGPKMYFDYAEKFNALRDISYAAHTNAVRHLPDLAPGQKMFLNLHPKDFTEYAHLDAASNPFRGHDLSRIVFEITERIYIDDPSGFTSLVRYFKSLGVGIAVDDLGSGYSSLEMLASLEPDYIKFDMSLIRGIDKNERKQKLLRALLYYGEQIGCRCVAEGVETPEELAFMAALKCDLIQGFLLFKPAESFRSDNDVSERLREVHVGWVRDMLARTA